LAATCAGPGWGGLRDTYSWSWGTATTADENVEILTLTLAFSLKGERISEAGCQKPGEPRPDFSTSLPVGRQARSLPDYVIQAGESFGWSVHNSILILFKAFYIAYLPE